MNDSIVTFGEAEGTRQEILKTTYCTLYEHGLAGLTISKIGKNFNKSSSVIYDYYETKEDLILDLLDCLLEIIEDEIIIDEPFSDTYLLKITDSIFDIYYEPDNMLFQVIAEMRAQAPHNEKLHNRLRQSDILVQERIEYAISIGVQEGMMDIRNSSVFAAFLSNLFIGLQIQSVTADAEKIECLRAISKNYINSHMIN